MKILTPLEKGKTTLEDVIKKKRVKTTKDRLTIALLSLDDRFKEYEDKKTALEKLARSAITDDNIKKDFIECYEGNTKPVQDIKSFIKLSQPTTCQYCGIDNIFPFDHYAPKKAFPEFSVLSNNLIPSCAKCNTFKGETWTNDDGDRQFINFYYDTEILSIRFLLCEVIITDSLPVATFSFDAACGLNYQQKKIVKSHLEKLHLCMRYKENANETLSEFIKEVRENVYDAEEQLADLKKVLQKKAKVKREKNGINHWQAALYEAMSENEDFLKLCRP